MKLNNDKITTPHYSKITEYYSTYIPYKPELRKYVGSINLTLLINQLERWFAYKPDIFYKFLSLCEHLNYQTNDSWVEELCFTEAEFRHAFDAIGVRYRSKSQLTDILNAQDDPFQDKYYLFYIDIKKGLTFYLRNAEQ